MELLSEVDTYTKGSCYPGSAVLDSQLRVLIHSCWHREPLRRPRVQNIVDRLASANVLPHNVERNVTITKMMASSSLNAPSMALPIDPARADPSTFRVRS